MGELDYLFVCLGGGGLLSGSALAAYALSPRCLVYGVEPEAGNDGQQSLRKGEVVRIPAPKTLADGAATTHLGNLTFPLIQKYVRDIVTVTDDQLVATMKFFAERMKMVVEPTGCPPPRPCCRTWCRCAARALGSSSAAATSTCRPTPNCSPFDFSTPARPCGCVDRKAESG